MKRYSIQKAKFFGVTCAMLVRLSDGATAIFAGEEVNELAYEYSECGKDINTLGDMYADQLSPVQA